MAYLDKYFSYLAIAFVMSMAFLYILGSVAEKAGLVAEPGGHKTHKRRVPLVGGLCISAAFFLAILLFDISLSEFRFLFFSSGLLLLAGLLDDYKDISPLQKFVFQTLAVGALVILGGIEVENLGYILDQENALTLGRYAWIFSLIAFLAVINSFNLIDGHDGVAASIFLAGIGTATLLYFIDPNKADEEFVVLLMLLGVTVIPFFVFNLEPLVGAKRQVFLGDAGSMFLGLMVCYCLISLSQGVGGVTQAVFSPVIAPWIIGIPLFDMAAVVALRVRRRKRISSADRDHLHHFLTNLGVSKHHVLFTIAGLQGACCAFAIFAVLYHLSDIVVAGIGVGTLACYCGLRLFADQKYNT